MIFAYVFVSLAIARLLFQAISFLSLLVLLPLIAIKSKKLRKVGSVEISSLRESSVSILLCQAVDRDLIYSVYFRIVTSRHEALSLRFPLRGGVRIQYFDGAFRFR